MRQKIYFCLILLYFLFGAVNITQTEEKNIQSYVVLSQWKIPIKKEQKFNFGVSPSIIVDSKNVYVSNNCFSNKYVDKFSSMGEYIGSISQSETFLPGGLTIDKEGNLYLVGAFPTDSAEIKLLGGL